MAVLMVTLTPFMSPWTIPSPCKYSRPSATSRHYLKEFLQFQYHCPSSRLPGGYNSTLDFLYPETRLCFHCPSTVTRGTLWARRIHRKVAIYCGDLTAAMWRPHMKIPEDIRSERIWLARRAKLHYLQKCSLIGILIDFQNLDGNIMTSKSAFKNRPKAPFSDGITYFFDVFEN